VRVRVLQTLRAGSLVNAEVRADGVPISLSFLGGRDTVVQIAPERDSYRVSEERALLETRIDMKSSVVRSSLFAAADAAGIPDSMAMQLGDVFGGDIDFHRDLRKGDRFTVVYEMHHLAGRPVRSGRVLAAEFVNQGRAYRAVHFSGGYYAPDGKNLRKAFLRSPLEFSRVSSGFGMRRHPFASPGARTRESITRRRRARACARWAMAWSSSPERGAVMATSWFSAIAANTPPLMRTSAVLPPACGAAQRWRRTTPSARRPDRMGYRSASALRVPCRRGGAQSVLDRNAGRAAFAGVGFSGVPVLRQPAHRAARPARQQQSRPAGVGRP